ncbi:MAG: hypothetical protein ABH879_07675 [archaeon]
MEITIMNKRENPLLSRTDLSVAVHFEGKTPSREELKKKASKDLDLKESCISIKKIETVFGQQQVNVALHIYKDEESRKKIEYGYLSKRGQKKESAEPKPAETPAKSAEPKPAETPAKSAEPKPAETPAKSAEPKPAETPTKSAEPKPAETPAKSAEPKPAASAGGVAETPKKKADA